MGWAAAALALALAAGPAESTADAPEPAPAAGRFTFALIPALTFGVSPVPSGDHALYFGRALPQRDGKRRWALGYQGTFSAGFADRYALLTHRHHVMAMTLEQAPRRLYAAAGGGVAINGLFFPIIEAEGRVGFYFPRARAGQRTRGVFGLLMRLGWNVGARELLPLPQLGLFIGFVVGPRQRPR